MVPVTLEATHSSQGVLLLLLLMMMVVVMRKSLDVSSSPPFWCRHHLPPRTPYGVDVGRRLSIEHKY